ncbi:hypothetical protein, partial [uncultured Agrobacterium sp.]|uniref:hypothetical protein n=1 Tax=uncultured Agrobacterium sp. TaxID=157277 RepID=UPI0025DF9FFF
MRSFGFICCASLSAVCRGQSRCFDKHWTGHFADNNKEFIVAGTNAALKSVDNTAPKYDGPIFDGDTHI